MIRVAVLGLCLLFTLGLVTVVAFSGVDWFWPAVLGSLGLYSAWRLFLAEQDDDAQSTILESDRTE